MVLVDFCLTAKLFALGRNQPPQQAGGGQPEQTHQRHAGLPAGDHQQQTDQSRNQGLADIAGKVVLRQGFFDAAAGFVGIGDQRGCQRMLRAGAETAEQQGHQQYRQTAGLAGNQVSHTGQRGTAHQQPLTAPASRQPAGQQLERRHHAGIGTAQQTHHGIADAKLGLPDRQQDIDQIGQPVMHRMGAAGRDQRTAPDSSIGRIRFGGDGGGFQIAHDVDGRKSGCVSLLPESIS